MRVSDCPACHGKRLKDKVLAVRIDGKSIIDITDLPVGGSAALFRDLKLTAKEKEIAVQIIKEILIIPDKDRCLADGAVAPYRNPMDGFRGQYLAILAKNYGFSPMTPIRDLTKEQYEALMFGSTKRMHFSMSMKGGDAQWSHTGEWEGLLPQTARLYAQTQSDWRKRELEGYMRVSDCPTCHGKRLKDKVLAVRIDGKSIIDVTDLPVGGSAAWFRHLKLTDKEREIAHQIIKEIQSRLDFLEKVGLGYLTLSRNAGTLSGGEAQRIRLATQIGSNLMGVLYVLDEPSIGLHQRDNRKLIETLRTLRDLGN